MKRSWEEMEAAFYDGRYSQLLATVEEFDRSDPRVRLAEASMRFAVEELIEPARVLVGELSTSSGNEEAEAMAAVLSARLHAAAHDYEAGYETALRALRLATQLKHPNLIADASGILSIYESEMRRPFEAVSLVTRAMKIPGIAPFRRRRLSESLALKFWSLGRLDALRRLRSELQGDIALRLDAMLARADGKSAADLEILMTRPRFEQAWNERQIAVEALISIAVLGNAAELKIARNSWAIELMRADTKSEHFYLRACAGAIIRLFEDGEGSELFYLLQFEG